MMYDQGSKYADKENTTQKKSRGGIVLTDNRPETIQKKENNTGLPNQLKSGIENLSGHSLDDVKVHYNSSKPAQLNAHAYAQGSQIHLGSGQEKHLPHEAWHVVQQKQGRVKPTKQLKAKVNINDDAGLEKEADVMGAKATQMKGETEKNKEVISSPIGTVVQRQKNIPDHTEVEVKEGGDILYGKTVYLDRYQVNEYSVEITETGGVKVAPRLETVPRAFPEKAEDKLLPGVRVNCRTREGNCKGTLKTVTEDEIQSYYVEITEDRGVRLPKPREENFNERYVKVHNGPKVQYAVTKFTPRSANFMHYHKTDSEVTSAEHIVPRTGKIDITNHGLGSGIYGLQGQSQAEVAHQEKTYDSKGERIVMQNPLVLQHGKHGEEFTAMSKGLQRMATDIKKSNPELAPANLEKSIDSWLKKNGAKIEEIHSLLHLVLLRFGIKQIPDSGILIKAIHKFLHEYLTAASHVDQPINFLMHELGFDGVFANNSKDNAFNRGNVAYLRKDDPTKKTSHEERLAKAL